MQLKHSDIWRAIDRLAEQNGFSPSGLARKAGLSPTAFNASKRATANRKRWPSTESIAHILRATNTNLEAFVALASPTGGTVRATLPLIGTDTVRKENSFDDEGRPVGKGWEEIGFPAIADARAFVLEIAGKSWEPAYREGDRLILSPAEKPRRGDRVVARLKKGELMIGELTRDNARTVELSVCGRSALTATLSLNDIEWMHRIIWASQ